MVNNLLAKKKKQCYFCVNNIREVDYKNPQMLRRFLSYEAKIAARRRTGLCAAHQRQLSVAIMRARFMALLPFVGR